MRKPEAFQSNQGRRDCGPSLTEERRGIAVQREDGGVVGRRLEVVGWYCLVKGGVEALTILLRRTTRVASNKDPGMAEVFSHPILVISEAEHVDVVVSRERVDIPSLRV
jgi:hypothetical protein